MEDVKLGRSGNEHDRRGLVASPRSLSRTLSRYPHLRTRLRYLSIWIPKGASAFEPLEKTFSEEEWQEALQMLLARLYADGTEALHLEISARGSWGVEAIRSALEDHDERVRTLHLDWDWARTGEGATARVGDGAT